MAKRTRKRKCKHCRSFFLPDPRNKNRQRYCNKSECRKASKADSQRRWLQKPENQDYFKGSDHVQRVQEWRKNHPGYWRKKRARPLKDALQDASSEKIVQKQEVIHQLPASEPPIPPALQDLLSSHDPVIIGLIGKLFGVTLQEDIAAFTRHLIRFGLDIINGSTQTAKGKGYDQKAHLVPGAGPKTAKTVQLGGSASGA